MRLQPRQLTSALPWLAQPLLVARALPLASPRRGPQLAPGGPRVVVHARGSVPRERASVRDAIAIPARRGGARAGGRAANMYVLNILHYQLCYTSGLHHNLTILLSASLSNLQRIRRNFSGEDVTASKALVCRTPQARHAPPTQDDGHPMPPVSPVCHRRPVIAVSTSSSFCARNLEPGCRWRHPRRSVGAE